MNAMWASMIRKILTTVGALMVAWGMIGDASQFGQLADTIISVVGGLVWIYGFCLTVWQTFRKAKEL